MFFHGLAISLLFISSMSFAQGRKPAVEDFVGIEVDHTQVAPQGTESLYNLEQDLAKIQEPEKTQQSDKFETSSQNKEWNGTNTFSLAFVLCLPVFIWLMVMNRLKKKASIESASNIKVLEKYRKEREKKSEETYKKVS